MTSPMTITAHLGTAVKQGHNVRDPKWIAKQTHIITGGKYEIWHHENVKDKYHELFDESVQEYNSKQTDSRRQIDDYHKEIKNSKQKNDSYEMIIGVGDITNRPSDEVGRDIMKEFVDGWEERNPNFVLTGVYYHADEAGAPHTHIDFIPVAYHNSRGMRVQNSKNQALREMGFQNENHRYGETESSQWIARERALLEELCVKRGLKIHHPQAGKGAKHLEKEAYILTQKIKELKKAIEKASDPKTYTADAKELYGAYLLLKVDHELDPEFQKLVSWLEGKIAEEKELEKELSSHKDKAPEEAKIIYTDFAPFEFD